MGTWREKLREKSNTRILGRALFIVGLLSGWGVALFFLLAAEPLHFSMLLAPAGFVALGLLLLFDDGIARHLMIQDEIEKFPDLIHDDIEALRQGKISPTHAMMLITLLALLGQIACIFLYRKWQASWMGCLNVNLVAVVAGFFIGVYGLRTTWFQERRKRFSWWIFFIPLMAFAISAFLGLYFAEPEIKSIRDLPVNQGVSYTATGSNERINEFDGRGIFSIMDGAMEIDCDDEACLVLVLVVIAIACIAASAFIPHFWIVATTILWVIMLLITARELLYRDSLNAEASQ